MPAHAQPQQTYSGSGVPAAGLGKTGDVYLRTDTGGWYTKAAGAWSLTLDLATQAELNAVANGGSLPVSTLTMPDQATDATAGLTIVDAATNNGQLLELRHHGAWSGGFQNYAIEIHNYPAANSAFILHQYSSAAPAFWLDNTDSAASIKVKMAENSTINPGKHGTGSFLEFWGYYVAGTTYADGVVSGTTNLQSTLATFVAEDVGKVITVAGVANTISAYVNAHNVTLGTVASNGSAITFTYTPKLPEAVMLAISDQLVFTNSATVPIQIIPTVPATVGLKIAMPVAATAEGLAITNNGTGSAIHITQKTADVTGGAGALLIDVQSTSQNTYGFQVNGYKHGATINTSADSASGDVLTVSKNGTGAGWALKIINKGTGLGLDVQTTFTLTGAQSDLTMAQFTPALAGAFTLTRLDYMQLANPTGAATVTDAAVFQFDAAIGTHKAVDSGTTKTSPGTVTAWVKVNINGTIHYLPAYASKTT